MSQKLIVVVGGTGKQGGSVARTFLNLPTWRVRITTRNPTSQAATELANLGAEVVQADLNDAASIEKAFTNANAIFLNTDYWAVWRPLKAALDAEGKSYESASEKAYETETGQGRRAVDAAAKVPSLERFIFSPLIDVIKASGGKYPRSQHANAKAWIANYIETAHPDLAKKTSLIYLGGYNDNPSLTPRPNEATGRYMFIMPLKNTFRMPIIDPSKSTGKFVRALIEDEQPGTKLLAYDTFPTISEIVSSWSNENGKEADLIPISIQALHEKMGMTWEHLDILSTLDETGDYMAGVEGYIEPQQLKASKI
ncbi:hypothetical protein M409DRAFT_27212 [Zasmidium cellare ATCC 36951]|uniref:NmrA-like domain-containing protein n=1 Tax=Zasmidium cellare ATCC 36951 TaxID=1080233 RepID=A0A6A6C6A6_ZASCE|nr:uncharacterized protein M409DRAFT_27212 [Zasmidium cellare ATCC 36951]KAF2162591.1 hypothetical protein M409DRAFT_27212 [Zasmidium cellare ATCC 36951]